MPVFEGLADRSFRFFGLDSGEAHLRKAGALVTRYALRSLVLSQRLLQTREMILMHHTNCGLHGTDEPALTLPLHRQAPPYAFRAFGDTDEVMRTAITRVREHPFLFEKRSDAGRRPSSVNNLQQWRIVVQRCDGQVLLPKTFT